MTRAAAFNGLDIILCAFFLANITNLFVFVATLVGVTPKIVSIFSICFFGVYLATNHNRALKIALLPEFVLWLIVIVIWPLCSALLSLHLDPREIGLQIIFYQITLCSACLLSKMGRAFFSKLLGLCLITTIIGLALSLTFPDFFEVAAANAAKPSFFKGRAYGFFLGPNVLAFSIVLFSVAWLSTRNNNGRYIFVCFFSLTIFAAVILTGSRSGIATFAVYLLITLVSLMWSKSKRKNVVASFAIKSFAASFIILGTVGVFMLVKRQLTNANAESMGHFDLTERVNSIGETDLTEDLSVQARFLQQAETIGKILEKPFLGHGLGAENRLQKEGALHGSSHNTLLTLTLNYGIFYVCLLMFALAYLCLSPGRVTAEKQIGLNSYFHFVILLVLIFQGIAVAMESRLVYIMIGIFITMKQSSFQFQQFTGYRKAPISATYPPHSAPA